MARSEAEIQEAIINELQKRGWIVKSTHGNLYQSGFPDLFATHKTYGQRWIEVKRPERTGDIFTPAQREFFPLLCANGSGVWVLTGETEDQLKLLRERPNALKLIIGY